MKVTNLIICCFLLQSAWGLDIPPGWLYGCVTDEETGDELIGANIYIEKEGVFVLGLSSDFKGRFRTQLDVGTYDIVISYTGYSDHKISDVLVRADVKTNLEVKLSSGIRLEEVVVTSYKVPLIEVDNTSSGATILIERQSLTVAPGPSRKRRKRRKNKKRTTKQDPVQNLPTKNISSLRAISAGVEDDEVNVIGSRSSASDYYIDGNRVRTEDAGMDEKSKTNPEKTMIYTEDNLLENEPMSEPEIREQIAAGVLTAGEINDFSKWDLWGDVAGEDLAAFQESWGIKPVERYSVQLVSPEGHAVVDASLVLQRDAEIIWQARTDNTGRAELWANAFEIANEQKQLSLNAIYKNTTYELKKQLKAFHEGLNLLEIPADCTPSPVVDIAFVVDATSSMKDEIAYLKAELNNLLKDAAELDSELVLRTAGVFYRDRKEEYLVRKSLFSIDPKETATFVKNNYARGGGDFPEAVEVGLQTAISDLNWSEEARTRLLFLILDAPPRQNLTVKKLLQEQIQLAASKGIRVIPLSCSGVDKSTEYLMRSLALLTNGTYTFLTDESGIGQAHIEPTTDTYKAELLNDLLLRLFFEYTFVSDCNASLFAKENMPNSWIQKKKMEQDRVIPSNKHIPSWKYYPNPSSGIVNLEFGSPVKFLRVFDLSGKLLHQVEWTEGKKGQIDLGDFSNGLYLLRYEGKKGETGSGELVLTGTD